MIRIEKLEKAAEAIIQAKAVHFFGLGSIWSCSYGCTAKIFAYQKHATAITDSHQVATLLGNADPSDVFVGISFSGETVEVVNLMEIANKRRMKTISISKIWGHTVGTCPDSIIHFG